jgi:xylan 1,4-beta-xylosidase
MRLRLVFLLPLLLIPAILPAQQAVTVRVKADMAEGAMKPTWMFFGYDEPNYTYLPGGGKLLGELSRLSAGPVYLRTHNLLTSGDGTPALKWGSTNAYSEDAAGRPVYDWTILDKIFDAYRDAGVRPFVEIGFMPRALSTHPEPYQHHWPKGTLWTGWAYPPKDYSKWGELVYQWVHHSVQRYGARAVASWYWEVWNEPNIGYWQGTPEEYFKLYDYAAAAVKRALPEARVGGPATTGPAWPKAAEFLKKFLTHCESGTNYVTGKTGAPLDFISFHAKGKTRFVDGHVEMGIANNLRDISKGFEIVAGFPRLKGLPVFITESDPEGCAACSAQVHPENGYRNTSQYSSYEAEMQRDALVLAAQDHINLGGALTWAFEYDDQPCFAGFRTLATCGIDKPILNAFRMLGLEGGERVEVESSGALPLEKLLASEARERADINGLASREARAVNILVWNYRDDAVTEPAATIHLSVEGMPAAARRILVEHFRTDDETSNSFAAWKKLGSPEHPTAVQLRELESAGQLQALRSPWWKTARSGKLNLEFELPSQAVSLVRLEW